jgi:hypothetical protein
MVQKNTSFKGALYKYRVFLRFGSLVCMLLLTTKESKHTITGNHSWLDKKL